MNRIFLGDTIEQMRANIPTESAQCVVTSPPYWGLRDYGIPGQIGQEETPGEFVQALVNVFSEVRRCLRRDGLAWVNLGDQWDRKQLQGTPWRVAFALQDAGWVLRQCIIWDRPNPMPEAVKDRCTNSHEYVFLLSKSGRYFWNYEAMQEDGVIEAGTRAAKGSQVRSELKDVNGRPPEYWEYTGKRNRRSVWTIPTKPFPGQHFATFPTALVEPMILASTRPGDMVLDPFMGSGTTACVAKKHRRQWVGCELNPAYLKMAMDRIEEEQPLLFVEEEVA